MRKAQVDVTVIMACRNSSLHLEEALDSVLNQTVTELEVILIDDGSTDDTLAIARRYQHIDDRLQILCFPTSLGPAAARNAGVCIANGQWIAILDSDDVALPPRFEEQLRLGKDDDSLVMIGSNSVSIDQYGDIIRRHRYPTNHRDLVKRLTCLRAFPPHSSMMYRKSALLSVASFNPRYVRSQDWDLWLRLSEAGKVASIDKSLVKIRKHQQNISSEKGGVAQQQFAVIASVCHFLRKTNNPDPSANYNEADWGRFVDWVENRMEGVGFCERRKAWTDARTGYINAKNRITGLGELAFGLMRSGHFVKLVLEKFVGTSFPQHLALEWVSEVKKTLGSSK